MRKKRKKTGIRALAALAFVFAWIAGAGAGTAGAQSKGGDRNPATITRTIQGQVLSASGAGVAGAVVLLKDGKTLQVRSYIAQTGGSYHFYGLSTDVNYTLRAEDQGQNMTSKAKAVSVFDSKKVVKLDLKLTKKIKPNKK